MNDEYAKNEREYIRKYQEKGYKDNYIFKNGKLVNPDSKNEYDPKDIHVVAEHRFEGMSNPSDLSILYIIKTQNDSKGTILVGYGPSANLELSEFFKSVPEDQYSNQNNIDHT